VPTLPTPTDALHEVERFVLADDELDVDADRRAVAPDEALERLCRLTIDVGHGRRILDEAELAVRARARWCA
jgi:hypothetical protein